MVESVRPASPAQHRRSVALVVFLVLLTLVGVVHRGRDASAAPPPCAAPALRQGVLVCDGQGSPAGARAWLAGERLDVNRATRSELEAIPGVGPAMAAAIVATRDTRGGYGTLEDLDEVPGIGEKRLRKLAAWLRVAPAR